MYENFHTLSPISSLKEYWSLKMYEDFQKLSPCSTTLKESRPFKLYAVSFQNSLPLVHSGKLGHISKLSPISAFWKKLGHFIEKYLNEN